MTAVAVTGAAGAVGRRLVRRLRADAAVDRLVAVDRVPVDPTDGVDVITGDLRDLDLDDVVDGADVVVHLAVDDAVDPGDEGSHRAERDATRRLLDALGRDTAFVAVSSATVYGAWSNNPVPITEQALLRPNPQFAYAMQRAEAERLVAARRRTGPGRVALLRPAVSVAEDEVSWLGHQLLNAAPFSVGEEDPGWQFLHLDDLAGAVHLAAVGDLDGPYNVAPDGALSGAQRRDLLRGRPRFAVAESVAEVLVRPLTRRRRVPRGLVPYTAHSWVVANDRLRAAGWTPTYTNEEALVAADEAPPWATMNARQRQHLALGAAGVGAVGVTAGGFAAVRALRRRASSGWGASSGWLP